MGWSNHNNDETKLGNGMEHMNLLMVGLNGAIQLIGGEKAPLERLDLSQWF